MLLELVEDIVEGHGGERPHINDVIHELEDESLSNRRDNSLRDRALIAIGPSSNTHNGDLNPAPTGIFLPQDVGEATFSDPEAGGGQ